MTKTLIESEKAQFLVNAMRDKDAKKIAKNAAFTGSYDKVRQALESNYNRPRFMYTFQAEKLVGHKKIHYNRTDFRELMQTFDNQVDGLAALKANTFNHMLGYLATCTFTDEVREHWKLYSGHLQIVDTRGGPD